MTHLPPPTSTHNTTSANKMEKKRREIRGREMRDGDPESEGTARKKRRRRAWRWRLGTAAVQLFVAPSTSSSSHHCHVTKEGSPPFVPCRHHSRRERKQMRQRSCCRSHCGRRCRRDRGRSPPSGRVPLMVVNQTSPLMLEKNPRVAVLVSNPPFLKLSATLLLISATTSVGVGVDAVLGLL
ncbi:uncharacterized protein LOC107614544 [Arachis ipaensis]|uniref:uncharacterized protein LOC107614544 n=1 Tax=Arachis ipaensis TaxID=130454 RepID=UPI0007AF2F9C|nr:uncharacterized protein LOC107614544 [Arachis ipaensis]